MVQDAVELAFDDPASAFCLIKTSKQWGWGMLQAVAKFRPRAATMAAVGLLAFATAAEAQVSTQTQSAPTQSTPNGTNSASSMWGTVPGPVAGNSFVDSATAHAQLGTVAGEVNAAEQGILLYSGPNTSITAIGSQSIVSTTIIGNNNSTGVSATQSSINSGTVSNNGSIAVP